MKKYQFVLWMLLSSFSSFCQQSSIVIPKKGKTGLVRDAEKISALQILNIDDPIQSSFVDGNRFRTSLKNSSSSSKSVKIKLLPDHPSDWDVHFSIGDKTYDDVARVNLPPGENGIYIMVTPGDTPAIGRYKLKIWVDDAQIFQVKEFVLLHHIQDLVIVPQDKLESKSTLTNFLSEKGMALGRMDIFEMLETFKLGLLSDLNAIYFSMQDDDLLVFDDLIHYFTDFLDHGGNIFLSGQNLGHDYYENYPYFFETYLGIQYLAKSKSLHIMESSMDGMTIPAFDINAQQSPDIIVANQEESLPLMKYEQGAIAGIYTNVNDFKVVFLGFDLDGLSESIVKEILGMTADLFDSETTSTVSIAQQNINHVVTFPNPSHAQIHIKFKDISAGKFKLWVTNSQGVMVEKSNLIVKNGVALLDIARFQNGLYFCHLIHPDGNVYTSEFIKF